MAASALVLLPLAWFAACLVWRAQRTERLREAFLVSAVLWGGVLTILTELLSLTRALTPVAVATAWLILCLPLLAVVIRERSIPAFAAQASRAWHSLSRLDRILVVLLGVVCGVLFGIAVISPPNNVDSFLYHISRVMHW